MGITLIDSILRKSLYILCRNRFRYIQLLPHQQYQYQQRVSSTVIIVTEYKGNLVCLYTYNKQTNTRRNNAEEVHPNYSNQKDVVVCNVQFGVHETISKALFVSRRLFRCCVLVVVDVPPPEGFDKISIKKGFKYNIPATT